MSADPDSQFVPFSAQDRRVVFMRFWRFTRGFWGGMTRQRAWSFTIGLAIGLIVVLLVNFAVNRWQSSLFNALEQKNGAKAFYTLAMLPLIVIGGATAGALVVYTRETLQVYWREWVVARLTERWLANSTYRRLQMEGREPANPEYRIADDVRLALDPLVDFAIGWFSALLAAVTFIGVLWHVGGSWTIHGTRFGEITIPAFMVIAAVVYGVVLSSISWIVGRPLVDAVARRNEIEARLRFDLTHVREHAARIAGEHSGSMAALARIRATYVGVVARTIDMIRYHVRLTWVTNGNGVLLPIAATALATPKYLAGDMSLGDLVSLGPAFHQVQMAMAWLVDNFRQVATWFASAGRVFDMIEAVDGEAAATAPSFEQIAEPVEPA
jgi:vitamin B12/bleomycin/antimicrobial peptide transport system ATP-binding/permease protein